MYYCNDCNEFSESKWSDELHTEVCTVCGSIEIEKASKCGSCGAPIKSSQDYCEECIKTANQFIDDFANQLEVLRETAKDLLLAVMEEKENE